MLKRIVIVGLLCLVTSVSNAQDDYAESRQELLAILSEIEAAINAKDIEPIKPYLLPDTVVTFVDAKVVVGTEGIVEYFERMLGSGESVLSDMTSKATVDAPAKFYSENIAVAHGHTIDSFTFRTGKTIDLRSEWTTTVLKDSGSWKIASLHFSNNLFDNPLLNASKKTLWIGVIAGFLAGVIIMWIGRRLLARRSRPA